MKFSEAVAALEAGKKIRKIKWTSKEFLVKDKKNHIVDELGNLTQISVMILSDDWEIVKEKKRVTLFRYTYKTGSGRIGQSQWTTSTSIDYLFGVRVLLKTETKEIEVDSE